MRADTLPFIDSWKTFTIRSENRTTRSGVHNSVDRLPPPYYGHLSTKASLRFSDSLGDRSRSTMLGISATFERHSAGNTVLPFTGYTHITK